MARDTYKSIRVSSQGVFKDKGSRFIAHAIPVKSTDDVKSFLEEYRKKYHDARHHCYAYVLGFERSIWRTNDDGEPSGTAGKPIMGQINSFGLTDILIVVIRYFGGTLLGTSGLINAYKTAAFEAINNSEVIELTLNDHFKVEFPYSSMNGVMKILKEENVTQTDQVFGMNCSLIISFRVSVKEKILRGLNLLEDIKLTHLQTK